MQNNSTNKDETTSNDNASKSMDDKLTRRQKIYLNNVENFNQSKEYLPMVTDVVCSLSTPMINRRDIEAHIKRISHVVGSDKLGDALNNIYDYAVDKKISDLCRFQK
jgi:hypothetical protein